MIRSYWVEYDTKRGEDCEHKFSSLPAAEAFYDKVSDVPYKVLKAYDDQKGDIIIKREIHEEV
ncbi:MAG: hypothetical protein IJ153_05550 [Clostridia bacterium]|nr:hypothetical protein [Clostridia bacterium]MBQ9211149.1 hypothetical protein [Clostridia bacterium]